MNNAGCKTVCLMLLCLSLVLSAAPLVRAEGDPVSGEQFKKVLQELKEIRSENRKLASEVKSLKHEKAAGDAALLVRIKDLESRLQERAAGALPAKDMEFIQEDVAQLTKLMDVVERKTLLDRLEIGAELRVRADWFDYKNNDTNHEEQVSGLFSNRLRLNLFSQITDRLRFNGRLVSYFNWNDNSQPSFPLHNSNNRARIPDDTDVKVERAYLDYFFNFGELFPMALTVGRLPNTDGMPTDLRNDTERKSTFPSFMWDLETDGAVLSLELNKLTGLKKSALRFLCGRIVLDSDQSLYRPGVYAPDNMDLFALQFETGFHRMRNTMLMLSAVYAPEWISPSLYSLGFRLKEDPGELGSVVKLGAYIQSKRFLQSNFDIFAGMGYARVDGNGKAAVWSTLGGLARMPLALNSSDGNRDTSSWGLHVGFRYNIPWQLLNGAKLGVEYNHGTKYWLGVNRGSDDPFGKLGTRGDAWEFYYIQPIDRHFKLRAGCILVDSRYSGANNVTYDPERIDEKLQDVYFLLDATF
ncbi:MAG: DUF3373 family protein [Deltaproteobacteria bacterium]|nr:DUF3373 family protein [Deltaproteobacteria bacterium]